MSEITVFLNGVCIGFCGGMVFISVVVLLIIRRKK